jgi:hypothetical protein
MGVVKLASQNLSDAFNGNEKALAKLTPAQADFLAQLQLMQPKLDKLRQTAGEGLLSGAGKGLRSAAGNFGVLNRVARATSGTLGGLAADAGKRLGSKSFGADLGTLGMTNVRIIGNLGHATLDLADAARHLLVEAGPLAEWLSENAAQGARLTDEWVKNKRATGESVEVLPPCPWRPDAARVDRRSRGRGI